MCVGCMDKNFGFFGRYFTEMSFFGRYFTEMSFFGELRKDKSKENSSARKIGRKSGLSAIFRRKIGNCRKIGGKIGSGQHALGGALTEGEVADFSLRS